VTSSQQHCKVQRPPVGLVIHPVIQQIHNICCWRCWVGPDAAAANYSLVILWCHSLQQQQH